MKKGIFAFFGYNMSLERRFKLIKEAGFDSVMAWWGDGTDEFEGKKFQYKSLAERIGLYICNAHLPCEDCNKIWIETSEGDEYIENVCNQIRECAEYDITTVVIHLSRGEETPLYNKTGIERLKRIVGTAEKYNMDLAFENLRRVEYLDYLFENIQSPKMGFCFDSGHNNCLTPERDMLGDYKQYLSALHLNDNMGDKDIHMLPFDGTSDWNRIAETLRSINYNGVLSLEVQQDRHEKYLGLSPEEYLSLAFSKAEELERILKSPK